MLLAAVTRQRALTRLTSSSYLNLPLQRVCNNGRFHKLQCRSLRQPQSLHLLHTVSRTPLDEIARLRELLNRAHATNSNLGKQKILAEYGDLRPLLSYILSPYCRLNITSGSLQKYLARREQDQWNNDEAPYLGATSSDAQSKTKAAGLRTEQEESVRVPSSLLELFQLLSSKEVTGGRALATVSKFLSHHGIIGKHEYALSGATGPDIATSGLSRGEVVRPTALDLFIRCLDRNLKAGFSERTMHLAFADVDHDEATALAEKESEGRESVQVSHGVIQSLDWSRTFKGPFESALGKSMSRAELPALLNSTRPQEWFASRKLDGVRCFFVVQGTLSSSNGQLVLTVDAVESLTRNGRQITSLSVVEQELSRLLPSCEAVKSLLSSNYGSNNEDLPAPVRFVLDGEICVLSPPDQASRQAKANFDVESIETSVQEASQPKDMFVEDFTAIVSLLRRKDYTIPNPAYFPFDLLTFEEFTNWRKQPSRRFSDRIKVVKAVVSHFQKHSNAVAGQSIIRNLPQEPVACVADVEQMIATASQRGWEGLILRRDVPYEGKRTAAVRKLKEWKDSEYTVTGVTVSTMRLAIAGIFEDREAMAAVQIIHKGSSVSVGSGFSSDERVRYARNPEEIIGNVVTVQYFEESVTGGTSNNDGSSGADPASYSLRFPRVKQIWGKERDV